MDSTLGIASTGLHPKWLNVTTIVQGAAPSEMLFIGVYTPLSIDVSTINPSQHT